VRILAAASIASTNLGRYQNDRLSAVTVNIWWKSALIIVGVMNTENVTVGLSASTIT
jgi:hypothetical protein